MLDMYETHKNMRKKYRQYFFEYGILQSYDNGGAIVVLDRPLNRYPMEVRSYVSNFSGFNIYSYYDVRKCFHCETYILLRNNNFYNINNKYICINCFNDENLTVTLYDNTDMIDHNADIRFYGSYFCGKKCSNIVE